MSRRTDPKARTQLNEAAATGRRRAQVQEQSSRQRDAALRSRRLLVELSGGAAGDGGEVSESALASLGPDVLAERVKAVAAALQRWRELPPAEWQSALQQLATLLSTGSYQPAQAALASGAVALLGSLLPLPAPQLPADAARRAAWALELLASSSPAAAGEVVPVVPVLVGRLAAAVVAVEAARREAGGGSGGGLTSGEGEAVLLEADQLAAVLGAVAGWNPELQGAVIGHGAASPLLRLVCSTLEPAVEAPASPPPAVTAGAAGSAVDPDQAMQTGGEPVAAAAAEPEAPVVRCCSMALWSLGMLVRGRPEEVLQHLVSQEALLSGLRRLLQAPVSPPGLLREGAWVLAFCTAAGGPDAAAVLVGLGGLLPGLLLATIRCVHRAAALSGEDQASHDAAQPLHQALLPMLLTLSNIASEPGQALPLLAELRASRPLPPLPLAPASAAAAGGSDTSSAPTEPGSVYASGMEALLACLEGRVSHRGVVRGGAALAAGLARGACRTGPVAVDSVRSALQGAGVVAALVRLLRGAALDIRKEAAAALTSLCEGAAGMGDGDGAAGRGLGPTGLDMLRSLGVYGNRDEQGVLAAFLGLLRSPDADAVHMGLRFVSLVLGGVKRGAQLVESLDGIDALEAVQYGTSGCTVKELQMWAEELVDTHYGESYGEEEEEDGEGDG